MFYTRQTDKHANDTYWNLKKTEKETQVIDILSSERASALARTQQNLVKQKRLISNLTHLLNKCDILMFLQEYWYIIALKN